MVIKLVDIREDVARLRTDGLPTGKSTGWDRVDQYFRPELGYFCVLTGVPGHGKSEWFDALIVNTIILHGWRWVIFSPENYPIAIHFNKLAEKFVGMPHKEAKDSEYKMASQMIDEYCTWIYPTNEDMTMNEVLAEVKQVKETYGANAFVLDPWNELDHNRRDGISETEHIEKSLRNFRRFCREQEMFGTIIAHPTKMTPNRDGKMPPLSLWSISGSAHWRNKADYGLVVHRENLEKNEPELQIQKIKQKNFGKIGSVQMYYDYKSGRLKDDLHAAFTLPKI